MISLCALAMLAAFGCVSPSSRIPGRTILGIDPVQLPPPQGSSVTVLALSSSTIAAEREVVAEKGWIAKAPSFMPGAMPLILAVVRSSLSDPLGRTYQKFWDLHRAAASCPNSNGPLVHVYLYAFFIDEGAYVSVDHWSFKAAEMPNKAPEPTPGAVTPRATEGASK